MFVVEAAESEGTGESSMRKIEEKINKTALSMASGVSKPQL